MIPCHKSESVDRSNFCELQVEEGFIYAMMMRNEYIQMRNEVIGRSQLPAVCGGNLSLDCVKAPE